MLPQLEAESPLPCGKSKAGQIKGGDRISWQKMELGNPCFAIITLMKSGESHGMKNYRAYRIDTKTQNNTPWLLLITREETAFTALASLSIRVVGGADITGFALMQEEGEHQIFSISVGFILT